IVYMIAFTTAGHVDETTESGGLPSGEDAQRMLVALVLLCSVAFVLPALMRLVAPAVATVGTGGSGLMVAGGAAVGAMALGAIGTKAVASRPAAAPGSAGYFGSGGAGPRPGGPGGGTGGGGGGAPRPTPPPRGGAPAPATTSSGSVPAGAARNVAAARTAANTTGRADQSMGDVAGDRWANRSPDLGRSTIPR
ncbi:hypothetical protein ACWGMO_34445, partial [Nocardia salmonicida]